jgi:hypothetical protein
VAGKKHGARRVGAVVLGLLLVGASALWALFWLFGLAWVGTPELGFALVLGACFALAIVVGACGVVLIAGATPSRRAWLVVGLAAVAPVVALAFVGAATSRHTDDVDGLAAVAVSERTGAKSVTTACVWEYDQHASELWRCDVSSAGGGDTCFVWFSERSGDAAVEVDRCERDEEVVARRVSDLYEIRRGNTKTARFCARETTGFGSSELWRCDLVPPGDDGYCWASVGWKSARQVSVAIRQCERELSAAVVTAYRQRGGRAPDRARCTEDEQDDGEWTCELGAPSDRDACIVFFAPAAAVTGARIAYCEREVVARVEDAFERTYEKRTRFDDVTANCRLREHERWSCTVLLPSDHDQCDVAVDMRPQGPKVDFVFTSCTSGRI